ncbi:MAG: ATP phosphoribosyltransferase regulatory subunit [Clostridiales bacterium]|nr:ATP phosphoribosyltransferase regulatory subunit [Clostridiales bacterium]
MGNNRFYTPDGFSDVLPGICEFKKEAESKLRSLFSLNGYSEIETPGIEYTDIYMDNEYVPAQNLYKLCDQKGRLITIRYDGTIPASRFAATIFKDEEPPLRLCYIENMYRYEQVGGGKQSEFTQAGVELMGSSGSAADAEVIALAIESALEIGIKDLQISIGQTKLFEGFMKGLKIDKDASDKIRNAINQKDVVTLEKTADDIGLTDEDKETLLMFSESQGTYDVIEAMRGRIDNETAVAALDNLKEILDFLDDYGYLKYVSIDLGLLGSDYYTGVIFKGFTYEVGFPILGGGRYDNVVGTFGRDMEAVGFSLGLSLAIIALIRQGMEPQASKPEAIIGYDIDVEGTRKAAIALKQQMVAEGTKVVLDTQGYTRDALEKYADDMGIDTCIFLDEAKEEA